MDRKSRIAEFNRQFSQPETAQLVAGNGGLAKIQLNAPSAKAEIYLHGAQITSWRPTGADEVLFVSEKSHWQSGKAIRGGIPLCFPWFRSKADNPHAPSHGFVRTREWELDSISPAAEGAVCTRLSIGSDGATREWWPFEFRLEYAITVGRSLTLELTMTNTGTSELKFEEALHTYFKVGNVRRVGVLGLDGVTYLDNRDGNREVKQEGALSLTRQTDNAYRNATGAIEIEDPVLARSLKTGKKGSNSTIVWNPWSDGAAGMSDFGDDEWQTMLCVEGGNILDSAVRLEPQESHTMNIVIDANAPGK